jgi:hypothetical protein
MVDLVLNEITTGLVESQAIVIWIVHCSQEETAHRPQPEDRH